MTDKWYAHARACAHTHTPKSAFELDDVTVLWNQGTHTHSKISIRT